MKLLRKKKPNRKKQHTRHSSSQQGIAAITYFVYYLDVLVVESDVSGPSGDTYPVRVEGVCSVSRANNDVAQEMRRVVVRFIVSVAHSRCVTLVSTVTSRG